MTLFRVDPEKCNGDGICVEICPVGILELDENGRPRGIPAIERHCVSCGHCVAVCPHGALDNVKTPLSRMSEMWRDEPVDRETAGHMLRARRSIRAYRDERVPRELLRELLDMARFAPSAHNAQGVSYIVVDTPEGMLAVREAVIGWMRSVVETDPEKADHYTMPGIIREHELGMDKLLRHAPALVVATVQKSVPLPENSSDLALEYAELYAPSLGLGTCWAGYCMLCARMSPVMKDFFHIPDDRVLTGMLMVGFPKYRYHRLPDRKPLKLTWYDDER